MNIVYPADFTEEARRILPDNSELHQTIADGKGREVGEIINKKIGRGYSPNPADVVELIRTMQTDEILVDKMLTEALESIDLQKLYSWWARIYSP